MAILAQDFSSTVMAPTMSTDDHGHSEIEMGSNRSFGIVFTIVFAAIGGYPMIDGEPGRIWSLVVAAIFLALSIIYPKALRPLNVIWFRFGLLLGRIVNPVVMLLIYVLAILPTGLILRLTGKDLLRLKLDPAQSSYWIVRTPPGPEPESLEELF